MNGSDVKKLRESLDLTQEQFAKKIGVSIRSIQNWEAGITKMSPGTAMLIKTTFVAGFNGKETKQAEKGSATLYSFTEHNIMDIPMVNQYAYAGYLAGYADQEYLHQLPRMPWVIDRERKGNYMCFEMRGESMYDGSASSYLPGDILLAREVRREYWKSKLHINNWDFIIVTKSDGILVKRIIKHDVDEGVLTLHSLNEDFEDFEINLDEIAQIFNVVDIKRTVRRR